MNKDKIKYLPFNLLWCVSSWIVPFLILTEFTDLDIIIIVIISAYIYFLDVKETTNIDYLENKINKLKKFIK